MGKWKRSEKVEKDGGSGEGKEIWIIGKVFGKSDNNEESK